jgi:high-affinity iron transporter
VQGVALGLAGTAVVGVLTLALQRKLPHKKMLIVTGVMIGVVLVTMVGGSMHTLQHVGWAPITPIRGLEDLPYGLGVWLGIYPTWQGVIAQIAAGVFVVGSYFVAERAQRRARLESAPAPSRGAVAA